MWPPADIPHRPGGHTGPPLREGTRVLLVRTICAVEQKGSVYEVQQQACQEAESDLLLFLPLGQPQDAAKPYAEDRDEGKRKKMGPC